MNKYDIDNSVSTSLPNFQVTTLSIHTALSMKMQVFFLIWTFKKQKLMYAGIFRQ